MVNVTRASREGLLAALEREGGVARQYEVLGEGESLEARRVLDELVVAGEVERFPVGDHIMLKLSE